MNFMVTKNRKIMINTYTNNRNESKYNLKHSHQIRREVSKRRRKEQKKDRNNQKARNKMARVSYLSVNNLFILNK